jgi:hypothetical protein
MPIMPIMPIMPFPNPETLNLDELRQLLARMRDEGDVDVPMMILIHLQSM